MHFIKGSIDDRPAIQSTHSCILLSLENFPGEQSMHSEIPPIETFPATQLVQLALPDVAVAKPLGIEREREREEKSAPNSHVHTFKNCSYLGQSVHEQLLSAPFELRYFPAEQFKQ